MLRGANKHDRVVVNVCNKVTLLCYKVKLNIYVSKLESTRLTCVMFAMTRADLTRWQTLYLTRRDASIILRLTETYY